MSWVGDAASEILHNCSKSLKNTMWKGKHDNMGCLQF